MSTMTVALGTCIRCARTYKFVGGRTGSWTAPCGDCLPALEVERTAWMAEHPTGFYPTFTVVVKSAKAKLGKKVCDEACTSARKEACTCQCGGRNHGAHYLAVAS